MWTDWADADRFEEAIRTGGARITRAEFRNVLTSATLMLPILDGSITDDATSSTRRTLTCSIPNRQVIWDALDTVRAEIRVTQRVRYTDGRFDAVPMGLFILQVDEMGYGPNDTISISDAPDLWGGVVAQVGLSPSERSSVRTNMAWQEIKRLVEGAFSAGTFPGWAQLDQTATAKVGSILYEDRESAILNICKANSVQVLFDRTGLAVLRPVPTLTATADASQSKFLVNAGPRGVMTAASRNRDRSRIKNVIRVSTSAPDVAFNPVEVANNDPADPLSTVGKLGRRVEEYSSPLIRSSTQARKAGQTRLAQTLGIAYRDTAETAPNPALDSEDIVTFAHPVTDVNRPRPAVLRILDTAVHPLSPQGTLSLTSRSTRPDAESA